MTTNQDGPNTAGAAEPVAWRVDDLTARGEVCGCFKLYTDYEKVEQHVAEGGVRFTKVTPLYPHPPENPPQRPSVVPDEVVEAAVKQGLSIATIGTPSEVQVQIAYNVARAAIPLIRAQAVAEIVAYLRMGEHVHSRSGSLESEMVFKLIADAIERGEHEND